MNITDKEKTEFLLKLAEEDYIQGSEYYAYRSKKGKWHFGHTNDYPLQHGNGNNTILSDNMVEILMKREAVNNLLISDVIDTEGECCESGCDRKHSHTNWWQCTVCKDTQAR